MTRLLIVSMCLLLGVAGLVLANDYYTHGTFPSASSPLSSAAMRAELDAISTGFDRLPTLAGNANKIVKVNNAANGLTTTTGGLSLAGNLTVVGPGDLTLSTVGATSLTLPTTGTLATLSGTETLYAKTLVTPVISSIVNGANILTLPAVTDTLVGTSASQVLSGKTYASPNITGSLTGSFSSTVIPVNLARSSTFTTVQNTTTETSIFSTTVPGGTLTPGRSVRLVLTAVYMNNSGANRQLIVRVKYGSTTVYTRTITAIPSTVNRRPLLIECELMGNIITNQYASTRSTLGSSNSPSGTGDVAFDTAFAGNGQPLEDASLDRTLSVTIQHDLASANVLTDFAVAHADIF